MFFGWHKHLIYVAIARTPSLSSQSAFPEIQDRRGRNNTQQISLPQTKYLHQSLQKGFKSIPNMKSTVHYASSLGSPPNKRNLMIDIITNKPKKENTKPELIRCIRRRSIVLFCSRWRSGIKRIEYQCQQFMSILLITRPMARKYLLNKTFDYPFSAKMQYIKINQKMNDPSELHSDKLG